MTAGEDFEVCECHPVAQDPNRLLLPGETVSVIGHPDRVVRRRYSSGHAPQGPVEIGAHVDYVDWAGHRVRGVVVGIRARAVGYSRRDPGVITVEEEL